MAATVERLLPYVTVVIGISLSPWAFGCYSAGPDVLRRAPCRRPCACAHGAARIDVRLRGGICARVTVLHRRPVPGGHRRRPFAGALPRRPGDLLAYGGGLGLLVGVLAIAIAFTRSTLIDRMRRIVPYVNRISGGLLVLSGSTSATTVSMRCVCSAGTAAQRSGDRHRRPGPRRACRLGAPARGLAVDASTGRPHHRRAGLSERKTVAPTATANITLPTRHATSAAAPQLCRQPATRSSHRRSPPTRPDTAVPPRSTPSFRECQGSAETTVKHQPKHCQASPETKCQASADVIQSFKWGGRGSNPRPTDYESAALTD